MVCVGSYQLLVIEVDSADGRQELDFGHVFSMPMRLYRTVQFIYQFNSPVDAFSQADNQIAAKQSHRKPEQLRQITGICGKCRDNLVDASKHADDRRSITFVIRGQSLLQRNKHLVQEVVVHIRRRQYAEGDECSCLNSRRKLKSRRCHQAHPASAPYIQ